MEVLTVKMHFVLSNCNTVVYFLCSHCVKVEGKKHGTLHSSFPYLKTEVESQVDLFLNTTILQDQNPTLSLN